MILPYSCAVITTRFAGKCTAILLKCTSSLLANIVQYDNHPCTLDNQRSYPLLYLCTEIQRHLTPKTRNKDNGNDMKRSILTLYLLALLGTAQAQSLDECQRAAESHYPLIRRSGLIAQTAELTVRNIEKGWLPQITASAQATYQSDVTAWPERMQETLQRMGLQMKGLTKDQYKLSLDLQQTLYDGGAIGSQSALARQEGRVQEVQNEVNLYQVRKRVNELYFSLLLIDEQIQLNDDIRALLLLYERSSCRPSSGSPLWSRAVQPLRATSSR